MLNRLLQLDKTRARAASQILGRSFENDPLWAYVIPELPRRRFLLPRMLALHLMMAVREGEVYSISSDLEGIAAWLRCEKPDFTLRQFLRDGGLAILPRLGAGTMKRLLNVARTVGPVRREFFPRKGYHLSPLGIDTRYQGRGYASRLLRPMLARLDSEGLPCYLETQNENNVAIYRHFGFRVLKEAAIPGSEVTHWSMLR